MKTIVNKDTSSLFIYTAILTQLRKFTIKQTRLRLARKTKLNKEDLVRILAFLTDLQLKQKELEKLIAKLARNLTVKQLVKWLLLCNVIDLFSSVIYAILAIMFFDENTNAKGLKKILWIKHAICLFYFLYFPLKILMLILKIGFLKIKISKH